MFDVRMDNIIANALVNKNIAISSSMYGKATAAL
jgi:hypothetical protein